MSEQKDQTEAADGQSLLTAGLDDEGWHMFKGRQDLYSAFNAE